MENDKKRKTNKVFRTLLLLPLVEKYIVPPPRLTPLDEPVFSFLNKLILGEKKIGVSK